MWFDHLQLAREIGKETEVGVVRNGEKTTVIERHFGTDDFASATGLSAKDASAWISKFVRWGYARRVGSEDNAGAKPKAVYALTEFGQNVEPKTKNRLSRLIQAVQVFLDADNEKAQAVALRALINVHDEVKVTKRTPRHKQVKTGGKK